MMKTSCCNLLLSSIIFICAIDLVHSSRFQENFVVNWAASNVRFIGSGNELQLVLDQNTGSGFASKNAYLFGRIDMQIKLVPGDSAGTVTAYYLSSETAHHDELDFEFLGNVSGQPYILQTNVFSSGIGGREQRIYLWFDPSADFHTYTVVWTEQRILFLVDGTLIRVFSNNEAVGVPYLSKQPMNVFSSIWNGDQWATEGGRIKIDWKHAPFIASYRNFRVVALRQLGISDGSLDSKLEKLAWVKKNYMVYDYCTDHLRYPTPPPDCTRIV
ncbi:hypothetical protein KP509_21G062100 [Ceratopteris richardii]|uniref:Xyloglucan endotransglucosylase/hydrolase n=1 Tax=Ceratopteris richardii TaxID=49495 RepID=A0A8T2SCL7_CERRI|nr:hypothetical protein KP509_21G062100 [Ceratopteris richardii]